VIGAPWRYLVCQNPRRNRLIGRLRFIYGPPIASVHDLKRLQHGALLYQNKSHSKHLTDNTSQTTPQTSTERNMNLSNVVLVFASMFVIVLAAPQPIVSMLHAFFHHTYLIIIRSSPRTKKFGALCDI
jgi:hypothetical protein